MVFGPVAGFAEVPQTAPGVPTGWGANSLGALGQPSSDGPDPVVNAAENPSTEVSMGCSHALYLHPDGTVWASGWNYDGQLGDGNSTDSSEAVQVSGLSNVTAIAAGCYHGVALKSDGTVWMWGQQQGVTTSNPPDGKCGSPGQEFECFVHPTQWIGPEHITQIAAGTLDEVALAADGTVYTGGQIGDAHLTLPAPVTDIAMQPYKAEAITTDGLVYTWGGSSSPMPVPGISGFATALGGGLGSGYAVTSDGKVWAWGDDRYGQLGDGKTTSQSTAIEVPGLPPIVAVAAGFWHAIALDRAGGVWGWGDNVDGEVGPQQPLEVDTLPSQVPNIGPALALSAGGYTTLTLIAPAPSSPPTVTKLKPAKGSVGGGTTVIISGTNLTGATAVRFGSVNARSFSVATIKGVLSIVAVSPAEPAGKVDVTVTTSGGGTSAITSHDRFAFVPTVEGVSPNSGPASGGSTVVVSGTGFAPGTFGTAFAFVKAKTKTVKAIGVNCTSTTECTIVVPAHEVGTVDVKATVSKMGSPKNPPADEFTFF
jgi:hypothetical protein